MRHRLTLGWMLVFAFAAPLVADSRQDAPAAPASRPAGDLASAKRLLSELASDTYQTRETARIALMGMKRSELSVLREAVKQSQPLEPSQVAVLHDIVTQIYLAGDDYIAVE